MATVANFTIDRGSNVCVELFARDSEGNYLNLVGHTASGYMRYKYNSGVIFDLQPTIDPSYISGAININLFGTGTTNLFPGVHYYDIYAYSGNNRTRIIQGQVYVSPDITR